VVISYKNQKVQTNTFKNKYKFMYLVHY